jgi:acyl-coenzyme A thioesterase PaaI-like protein
MRWAQTATNNLAAVSSEFEIATAVTALDGQILPADPSESADRVYRFAARIHPGWDIGGNANGGYLMAIVARAMAAVTGRPPLTVTGHYLSPGPVGDCSVDVTLVRSGRRMATATGSMKMGDREILRMLGTFADQDDSAVLYTDGAPPELPEYAECVNAPGPLDAALPGLVARLDSRLRPGDDGFRTGTPTGVAEIAGWFDFADRGPIDSFGLLLAADAFPPPIFNTDVPAAWVPTLELTVHLRALPAPGPLRCVFRSRFIQGGLLDEDAEIWDAAGQMVCQARQLALIPKG